MTKRNVVFECRKAVHRGVAFLLAVSVYLAQGLCALESEDEKSAFKVLKNANAVSLAWSNDGSFYAAGCSTPSSAVWNAQDALVRAISGQMSSVLFSADGKRLFTVDSKGMPSILNINEKDTAAMTLFDRVNRPIKSLALGSSQYEVLFSYGENAVIESFQLMLTSDAVVKQKMKFYGNVTFLTSSYKAGKGIVVTDNGKAALIDINDCVVIEMFDYSNNLLKPQITSGGTFVIPNAAGGLDVYSKDALLLTIQAKEDAILSYSLSESGERIVVAESSGLVRILNVPNGEEIVAITIDKDAASIMSISPNEESLLIGTKQGYICRWDFADEIKNAPVAVQDGLQAEEEEPPTSPKDSINISLGYSDLPEDYFYGAWMLQSSWRHYFERLWYCGADISFGLGLPSNDFPYTYRKSNGKVLSEPYLYEISIGAAGGVEYYIAKYDLSPFCEALLGVNGHWLSDNDSNTGDFEAGLYFGAALGVQWKSVRASFDAIYDTNFDMRLGGRIGVVLPLPSKKR